MANLGNHPASILASVARAAGSWPGLEQQELAISFPNDVPKPSRHWPNSQALCIWVQRNCISSLLKVTEDPFCLIWTGKSILQLWYVSSGIYEDTEWTPRALELPSMQPARWLDLQSVFESWKLSQITDLDHGLFLLEFLPCNLDRTSLHFHVQQWHFSNTDA